MKSIDFKPRKSLGQNFLIDQNILKKIAEEASLSANEPVLEIGPGMGTLTQHLLSKCLGVLAIDIDKRLKDTLEEIFADRDNFHLLIEDILTVDIEKTMDSVFTEPIETFSVCANIPYHITSPIIFKLLEECPHLRVATLMMQKEVATRILAKPNSKEYGLLTVMINLYADVKFLFNVSMNCFFPRPQVDSAVIQIIPRQQSLKCKDHETLKNFLKFAFQRRRKTILNICSDYFNKDKAEVGKILDNVDIIGQRRPETFSIYEFIHLIDQFSG